MTPLITYAVTALGLGCPPLSAQTHQGLPKHVTFIYAANTEVHGQSFLVHTPSGQQLKFSLFLEKNGTGQVEGVEVQLQRTTGDTGENLLDPPGDSHGMQNDDFEAWDLQRGSLSGNQRILSVRNLGLQVTIAASAVSIVGTANEAVIEHLQLDITLQRTSSTHKLVHTGADH